MTSEIRANTIKNRVGLGTVSYTNTGIIVSGIVTANSFSGPIVAGAGTSDIVAGIITATDLDISGDIDVDGHTNLDNVNVGGATTTTGVVVINAGTQSTNKTTGALRVVGGAGIQGNVNVGGDLDVDGHTNLDNVSVAGVSTVSTFLQVLGQAGTSDKGLEVRSNSTQSTDTNQAIRVRNNSTTDTFKVSYKGKVQATSFHGDGSNLTGITQTTISGNANNRIITGSGTANTLNGESTFTYDGDGLLSMTSTSGSAEFTIVGPNNTDSGIYFNDGSNDGAISYDHSTRQLKFRAGGHTRMYFAGGNDSNNNVVYLSNASYDDGILQYYNGGLYLKTGSSNGDRIITFYTAGSQRVTIDPDGDVGIGDNNPNIRLTVVDSGTENLVRIGRSDASGHASHTVNVKASKDFYHNFKMEASSYNLDCYNGSAMIDAFKVHNTGFAEFAGANDVRLTLGSYGTAGSNGANWLRGVGNSLYYNAAAADHLWEIGGAEHMRLNNSGNLYLRSESANYVVLGNSGDATSNNVTNSMNWIRGNQTHLQYNSNGGMHSWEISGAEKLRIDSDGTLKLTTPGNTQQQTFFTTFTINNTNSSTYSRIRFDRSNVSRWGLSLNNNDNFAITNLYKNGSVGANDHTFTIKNDDKVGLNLSSPQAQLHIKHGNSNTDSGLMIQSSVGRYHQTFCGQVTFPSSNGWVNFIYSDHSHSIEIQYMILEDENAGYGGAHGRLSFFTTYGNSSGPVYHENRRNAMNGGGITGDPEFHYQNTGGTVSHMIRVRLTYNTSRTFRMHYMVRGFATGRMYQL